MNKVRTYGTLILDAIESEKPDIFKLDGSHTKLLDHLITLPVLSKIHVFTIDMPPHLYDGNMRSFYIFEVLVAVNSAISQTYLDNNKKRRKLVTQTPKWIITAEQHRPASF